MKISGTETEKNLYRTFAGESRAYSKYIFYAEKAKCEGYRWIANVFSEIAEQEKAHAREVFKKYLKKVNSLEDNLKDSIEGELNEVKSKYKQYEQIARDEGFDEIAEFYKELQEVEDYHAKRFSQILKKVEEDKIFFKDKLTYWQCMNCGYIYEGDEAPKCCPLCKYPRAYFKLVCKNEE